MNAVLLAALLVAQPAPEAVASYRIKVRLFPERRLLAGEEEATFRNAGPAPVADLRLHLYPQAFANTGSVFLSELAAEDERGEIARIRRDDRFGYMRVTRVALGEGDLDLASATRFDDTRMTVSLPEALAPGASVMLRIGFEVRLPRWIRRMGMHGDHVDAMQWFPKFCARRGGRWIDHPYHLASEFAADFGTYDVEITVPERFAEVEATGVPVRRERNPDGTVTHVFHAGRVHDFAWIANPRFRRFTRTVPSPGSPGDQVEIVLMAQPDHAGMKDRILDAAEFCLKELGRLLPYPYPRLVIDDEPMGRSGGMEYPMLFTISMLGQEPRFSMGPEGVTMHELGHQYFHGIVATNEFEEAWLDEGIDTYVTNRLIDRYFGPAPPGRLSTGLLAWALTSVLEKGIGVEVGGVRLGLDQVLGFEESPLGGPDGSLLGIGVSLHGLHLPGLGGGRSLSQKRRYLPFATGNEPLPTASWAFPRGGYRAAVYSKASLVLQTIERHVGEAAMEDLIGAWVREQAFRHPRTADFVDLLERRLAKDVQGPPFPARAFSEELIHGTGAVDFAIEDVTTKELETPVGYDLEPRVGGGVTRRDAPSPRLLPGGKAWRTRVVVRRLGEVRLPVELLVAFEDGSERREVWDGREASRVFEFDGPAPAVRAVLDPDRKFALERNRNDNAWSRSPDRAAVAALAATVLFWIQSLLHAASSFS